MNCIAVDDESLALSKIKRYAEKIEYLNLLHCFDNAIDSLYFLKENEIHLIFLDIQMKDFTGIQLIESMFNPPQIILTTAYDQYAIKGYELNVTDYLLKPIQFDRFLKACEKAYSNFQNSIKLQQAKMSISPVSEKENFMYAKTGTSMVKINFQDIFYIEGMKDYIAIHTEQGRIITLQTFGSILSILPEKDFIRIHKSFVVATKKIDKILTNDIEIKGKTLPIGRTYKTFFLNSIKKA